MTYDSSTSQLLIRQRVNIKWDRHNTVVESYVIMMITHFSSTRLSISVVALTSSVWRRRISASSSASRSDMMEIAHELPYQRAKLAGVAR